MIKFKIISDPYRREIKFATIDSDSGQEIPVTEADNNDLTSDELTHGFFPYSMKKIIDEIYAMKSKPGERVQIIFEGTDDEYEDLKDLCSDEYYADKIILLPQEHYLNNAKDILPKISEIFQEMQPLIEESICSNEQVMLNKKKFEESVDKQVIPICVIGNYSSGKSTFINALVGKEILPSGDDPVTDCVYQITRSQNAESGSVELKYRGLPLHFSMDEYNHGKGCTISGDRKCEDEFMTLIQEKLDAIALNPVHVRIHELLAIIETHKKKCKRENREKDIDPLIKITLPFSKEGVLSQSQCRYVVFDTPGEGSATNADHSKILEKQMQSLSNGLIMFITDNKSLDKIEGRDLCEKLIAMECFDNRFTMVIANRADCAKLPKEGFQDEDIENKIGQTVCQTLHSQRIFYVSSIVGLGAKQGEEFIDEDYQDVYDKEITSYTNSEAKHPKSLYRYDIVPEQVKRRCIEQSERESNKAFANSGLFWIEQEIRIFAEVYSPYNKCTQSKYFLDEIIIETSARIDEKQENKESIRKTLNERMDTDKFACVEKLEKKAESLCGEFYNAYPAAMQSIVPSAAYTIKDEDLEKRQSEIKADIQEENNYAAQKENARILKHLTHNEVEVQTVDALKNTDIIEEDESMLLAVKKAAQSKAKSFLESMDKKVQLHNLERKMEFEISEILFKEVKDKFDSEIKKHQMTLETASEEYWKNNSESFRSNMIDAITNSEGIPEDKKKELGEIIESFEALELEEIADEVFKFDDFKRFFFFFLNLKKLAIRYNTLMYNYLVEISERLRKSHEKSYQEWEQSLMQKLRDNIIKLNPELRKLQEQIDSQAQEILNLKNRKKRLLGYQLEIEHLMDWN